MILFRETRLRTSLIFLLVSTSLVTITIVGSAILAIRLPQISEANQNLVVRSADEKRNRVEKFLLELEEHVRLVGQAVNNYPAEQIVSMLNTARGNDFEAVYLVSPDGRVTANSIRNLSHERSLEMVGTDLSTNKLVRAVLQSNSVVWSDKFLSAVTGHVTIGVGVPVAQTGGVVIAELQLETLLQISLIAGGHSEDNFWIIDGFGEVVADTGSPSAIGRNMLNLPVVQNTLSGSPQVVTTHYGGIDYHTAASSSNALGWLFISRIPAGLNNRKIQETIGLILIAFFASPVIGLLLAPFWARGMTSALSQVTKRARLVASGAAPDTWPRGNITEFNELANDLEEMWERLEKVAIEQIALSKDLVKAKDRAEAANLAKSNFLATMSHEIRTPLNGVLGLAQLLKDSGLDRDQHQKIETLLSSGQTLLAIINDVLDMSKIEAGGIQLEEKSFSMKGLISTITSPYQNLADDKGIKLVVKDQGNSDYAVIGDPVRTRQILWNLLSNAIKFTDQGSVTLKFEKQEWPENIENIASVKKSTLLVFTVEDTGAGIAPERIDAIFDAFTQEDDSITRKFGGTGLGLSIVKQLTEIMGGTIHVASEQDKGSTFTVYLPFDEVPDNEVELMNQRESDAKTLTSVRLNILIAEDNEVNAIIAKAFLEKQGHAVRHVVNGEDAVKSIADGWANFVLMDIHMPVMNGIDATRAIRALETGANLPIVGLTAEAFADRHALFVEAGMNAVLTKPYTESQLAETLALYRTDDVLVDGEEEYQGRDHFTSAQVTEPAAAAAPAAPMVGDDKKLDELRAQLPADVILNLLSEAQLTLQTRSDELKSSLEEGNSEKVREAAHAIKGAAGSMFAMHVSALATEFEEQSEDLDGLRQRLPEFDLTVMQALTWWQSQAQE